MKKRTAAAILGLLCLMGMLTGCAKKKEEAQQPGETVGIAEGLYQYEQGYSLAAGWLYDMTISAEKQIAELNALLDGVEFEATGEDCLLPVSGYRLVWYDAAGSATREMLILSETQASMDGLMYRMNGGEALYRWLDALKLEEQIVAE